MVSSLVCCSKNLSDEPMMSRGIPAPGFPVWYRLWGKGGNFGKYDQKLRENYKLSIFWKNY